MADCYDGPNPVKDDERFAIWKWAKDQGGIDKGVPIEQVGKAINDHFFGGQGKPEWINDILSGRKTPFREVATDMWKKQYNRRLITQQAADISRMAAMGPVGRTLRKLWTVPRSVAVFGHGVVFPVTHAGDLVFRPASWGDFIKGTLRTYRGALVPSRLGGGSAYVERVLAGIKQDKLTGKLAGIVQGDSLYDLALRSKVDVGDNSHPSGLISRYYHGPAQRAWDMLTVMRYELWKGQMEKYLKPGMTSAEALDLGQNLAQWANHATGSGKGLVEKAGGILFGPKLTQSKLNRITTDPIQTAKTFLNWKEASVGERAAAMTRLSGSTQFLVTNLGFLAVNAGLLSALGSKEKINFFNPFSSDFLQFKGYGLEGNVPGLHSEIRALARILATSFASKKPPGWMPAAAANLQAQYAKSLRGEPKQIEIGKTLGLYGMGKATPAIQRTLEVMTRQDYLGRPLPFSEEPGTEKRPKVSWGEYAGDIGPIPLSGPSGFVYDQLRKSGMSALDSQNMVKALIITGIGLPGFHVREQKTTTAQ